VEDETTEGGNGERVPETVVVGEYWKGECEFIGLGTCICYQCSSELKLKDYVYWEHMDCVEINTYASNDQNSLEPKPSELGLAQIVNNVIHIRNKYDSL